MNSKQIALLVAASTAFACSSGSSSDNSTQGAGGHSASTASTTDSGSGGNTTTSVTSASGNSTATNSSSGAGPTSTTSSASSSSSGSGGKGGPWKGLNLSSAEWGNVPGTYGKDYTYPTHDEIDRYTGLKMTIFRIPFRWERLQPTLDGALDATELGKLDDIVNYATGKGVHVIVDPHNYARYNDVVIGATGLTSGNLADFWGKLGAHFAGNSLVILGLMNEPHDIDVKVWLDAANASIAAIRGAGSTNFILVPGTNWTGAASWTTSNTAMLGIVDSGNNFAYEVHQYLDSDSSGTHTTCVSATIGTERLMSFMAWLSTNNKKGFLGEFGGGASADTQGQDATCASAMDSMLSLVESRPDLWLGWAYWAGGPWWQNGFSYSITDKATPWQLTLLGTHL